MKRDSERHDNRKIRGSGFAEKDLNSSLHVDFHVHSSCSDGTLSPLELAEKLTSAGITIAALTDHDSIAGIDEFRKAFEQKGGVAFTGVELSTKFQEKDIHLLAYGFDTESPLIQKALKSDAGFRELVFLLHSAGGLVFLAHPLTSYEKREELEQALPLMKDAGLDGIEAVYSQYSDEECLYLAELANQHSLLVSGGSDYHGSSPYGGRSPGVEIPGHLWKSLRNSLNAVKRHDSEATLTHSGFLPGKAFSMRIILPTLLVIGMFIAMMYYLVMPSFKENLLNRKRETIRELTDSAWGILNWCETQVQNGNLSLAEAKNLAANQIQNLRYGKEGKDYFWITDYQPVMIMHPYRKDLVEQDLSDFRDPLGNYPFMEFLKTVQENGSGYVNYVWQWKDNPDRLENKESYVRGFLPWKWIIGTGIYTGDVNQEINSITERIVAVSAVILAITAILLFYLVHQTFRIELQRQRTELDLFASRERYRTLAEASTEGTLVVLDGRCSYFNSRFLKMSGYMDNELSLLSVSDLFPERSTKIIAEKKGASNPLETMLRQKNGSTVPVLLTVTDVEFADRKGLIVVVRDLSEQRGIPVMKETGVSHLKNSFGLAETSGSGSFHSDKLFTGIEELKKSIKEATSAEQLANSRNMLESCVNSLLVSGINPHMITETITVMTDAITSKVTEMVIKEMGDPPCAYAIIALGSQGRLEQTLISDQDNALIYEDSLDDEDNERESYFLELGMRLNTILEKIGFPYCEGGNLAGTRQWNQPLSQWKSYFADWINQPDVQELLYFSIFLDFRFIVGKENICLSLKQEVFNQLSGRETFFFQLARDQLRYKVPISFFGSISSSKGGSASNRINVKKALHAVVNFARLYSLKNGISETPTINRIYALSKAGAMNRDDEVHLIQTFELLLMHRLRSHLPLSRQKGLEDSVIPKRLTPIEIAALKQALEQILILQKKVSLEFPGAAEV